MKTTEKQKKKRQEYYKNRQKGIVSTEWQNAFIGNIKYETLCETLKIIYEKATIPNIIEVQNYFFNKGDRNIKAPLQFFAYYNAVGWPKNWKKKAYRFINR